MATLDIAREHSLLPVLEEGKPDAQGWMRRRAVGAGIVVLVAILPLFLDSTWSQRAAKGVVFVIIGLSVNVLTGYAGQVSLGHQAFVGIGAFTAGLLVSKASLTFWIAVIGSAATGALAAVALGMVALRLKGLYLALITLAYGTVATDSIFAIPAITGGGAGVEAPRPGGFTSDRGYVYVCLFFAAIVWAVDWRFTKTKAGRAIFTIRENEIAAASFGINVVFYKLLAFVMSGAVAGLAGALFAHLNRFVVSTDFDFTLALTWVLMTAVGGLGSRPGVAIGSAFFAIFPLAFGDVWKAVAGSELPPKLIHLTPALGALLLLLTLTLYPGGIGQQLRPLTDWLEGKPFSFRRHDEGGVQAGGAGVRP